MSAQRPGQGQQLGNSLPGSLPVSRLQTQTGSVDNCFTKVFIPALSGETGLFDSLRSQEGKGGSA